MENELKGTTRKGETCTLCEKDREMRNSRIVELPSVSIITSAVQEPRNGEIILIINLYTVSPIFALNHVPGLDNWCHDELLYVKHDS